jgi:hypothetical protein
MPMGISSHEEARGLLRIDVFYDVVKVPSVSETSAQAIGVLCRGAPRPLLPINPMIHLNQ